MDKISEKVIWLPFKTQQKMDFCRGATSAGTFFFSAKLRFKLSYVLISFMKTPVLLRTRNMSGCTVGIWGEEL